MLRFIDVSNHQGRAGMDLSRVLPCVGGVVCKATEGVGFVDAYCDPFVQTCRAAGKPWGFYHFAREASPKEEFAYFLNNTSARESPSSTGRATSPSRGSTSSCAASTARPGCGLGLTATRGASTRAAWSRTA